MGACADLWRIWPTLTLGDGLADRPCGKSKCDFTFWNPMLCSGESSLLLGGVLNGEVLFPLSLLTLSDCVLTDRSRSLPATPGLAARLIGGGFCAVYGLA